MLLAPAERSDVIVDFSQYAGKTLILYNDAPAAFPARVASYDYYTGGPDLSPAGAPSTLPGYGPNTRTIMQIKNRHWFITGIQFERPTGSIQTPCRWFRCIRVRSAPHYCRAGSLQFCLWYQFCHSRLV